MKEIAVVRTTLTICFTAFIVLIICMMASPSLASSSSPSVPFIPPNTLIPGENCGVVEPTSNNRCCSIPEYKVQNLPSAGILDLIMGKLQDLFNRISEPIQKKLIGNITKEVKVPCIEGVPSTPGDLFDANCKCIKEVVDISSLDRLCRWIKDPKEKDKCINSCLKNGGIWTGIGCVKTDVKAFIQETVLTTGTGIAGGISLLCILFAAFQMQTSQGNAEKIKKAQQLLTNCITGLMLIIFSVLILKIIGVDILRIPGFISR